MDVQVLKVLEGHTDDVLSVAISVDGGKIVSGSGDDTVRVWSMETGEVRRLLGTPFLQSTEVNSSDFCSDTCKHTHFH